MKTVWVENELQKKHLILGGLALLSTILLCYADILIKMVKQWTLDPNYSHGFLIPILSAHVIWRKNDTFKLADIHPTHWGLPVLLLGLLLLILGKAGSEYFTMRFSFIVVLFGLLFFLLGTDIAKSTLFPIGYLVFMIPLPYVMYNSVAFPLRVLTTICSTKILSFIGIPIVQEGNIIHLTNASLQVVDACSGLRSLISLLALAVLFAYLTQKSLWKRIFLAFLTIPIAILSNSFRLTLTGILVDHFGPKATEGFFHIFSGMVMFAIALALLFFCGFSLSKIRR